MTDKAYQETMYIKALAAAVVIDMINIITLP